MSLTISIDDHAVMQMLHRTTEGLNRLMTLVAEEVALEAREAGGAVTPKLGARWLIEGVGNERRIKAPEWWAHFLAGGTRDHGPRNAPSLVFTIDGNTISAAQVRGIPATHFDKKAVDRARPHVRSILDRILAEAEL